MLKNDFFQKVKKMPSYYFFKINKKYFCDFSEKPLLSLQISHLKKNWLISQKNGPNLSKKIVCKGFSF